MVSATFRLEWTLGNAHAKVEKRGGQKGRQGISPGGLGLATVNPGRPYSREGVLDQAWL